jgi:hypothetical protein
MVHYAQGQKSPGACLYFHISDAYLMYFIFLANKHGYDFLIYAGDEQAHVVSGFSDVERTKIFVGEAARQAVGIIESGPMGGLVGEQSDGRTDRH